MARIEAEDTRACYSASLLWLALFTPLYLCPAHLHSPSVVRPLCAHLLSPQPNHLCAISPLAPSPDRWLAADPRSFRWASVEEAAGTDGMVSRGILLLLLRILSIAGETPWHTLSSPQTPSLFFALPYATKEDSARALVLDPSWWSSNSLALVPIWHIIVLYIVTSAVLGKNKRRLDDCCLEHLGSSCRTKPSSSCL